MKRKERERELKGEDGNWITTNIQNVTSNTSEPWRPMCRIGKSTAITGREGNRIHLKSVRARGVIKTTFQPVDGQYQNDVVRVIFILIESPTNMPGTTFTEKSNPKYGSLFTLTTGGGSLWRSENDWLSRLRTRIDNQSVEGGIHRVEPTSGRTNAIRKCEYDGRDRNGFNYSGDEKSDRI